MFTGGFTHEGTKCTFETLIEHFAIDDLLLKKIGHIIHDLDIKDGCFNLDETAGVKLLLEGIIKKSANDAKKLALGFHLLNQLYDSFLDQSA